MQLGDHLEKLEYFQTIATYGSFKKAADVLHVTQPSLTKSIKILENACEKELFIRQTRGVKLTSEGEILFDFCKSLQGQLADVEKKLSCPHDVYSGYLRVGTYDSIGIYFWPKFLKSFVQKFPNIDIELNTDRSLEIYDKLNEGELDLAIVVNPKQSPNLITETLKNDSFRLYASNLQNRTIYQSEKEIPIILMPDARGHRTKLIENIPIELLKNRRIYRTSSLESVKELTLTGIGLGFLPQLVAKDALENNLLIEYKTEFTADLQFGEHSIGLAYPKKSTLHPLIEVLANEIRQSF